MPFRHKWTTWWQFSWDFLIRKTVDVKSTFRYVKCVCFFIFIDSLASISMLCMEFCQIMPNIMPETLVVRENIALNPIWTKFVNDNSPLWSHSSLYNQSSEYTFWLLNFVQNLQKTQETDYFKKCERFSAAIGEQISITQSMHFKKMFVDLLSSGNLMKVLHCIKRGLRDF